MLKTLILSAGLIFSTMASAELHTLPAGTVPIPASAQIESNGIFSIRESKASNGASVYVLPEKFGMINIEQDVWFDKPVTESEEGEVRTQALDYGWQVGEWVVNHLYGVPAYEVHVKEIYLGTPAKSPEGAIVLADVKFIYQGKIYNARAGVVVQDRRVDEPQKDVYFIYPMTR